MERLACGGRGWPMSVCTLDGPRLTRACCSSALRLGLARETPERAKGLA